MTYTVKIAGHPDVKTFTDIEALIAFLRSFDVVTDLRIRIALEEGQ